MFYTNVSLNKNIITEYWIDDNGRRKKTTEKFKPSLAIINNNPDIKCDYEVIHGNPLALLPFDSCMDMYSWKKENSKYIETTNGSIMV